MEWIEVEKLEVMGRIDTDFSPQRLLILD